MSKITSGLTTHQISADETGNSTKVLLTSSATYTGAWEDVTAFATVAVAIKGDNSTDGTLYIESSQDGGITVNSVPFVVADASFDLPHLWNVVETHIRVKYTNGTTAQTGHFQLQTKYSNAQQLGLLQQANDTINGETDVQIVKSVGTGANADGAYVNLPANGIDSNNTLSVNLGISGVFTGTWTDVRNYSEIRVSYDADKQGASCFLQFSPDASTVERSISVPPQANTLQTNFGAVHTLNPILTYFRVVYTNGTTATTSFNFTTLLSVTTGGGLISRSTQILNKYNDVGLQRVINSADSDRNFGLLNYQTAGRKFGHNNTVGTGAFETLWTYTADWIPAQSAETIRIKAGGNAADDTAGAGAQTVEVTFLDGNWDEVTETIVTAGASASLATTATCIRLLRARIVNIGTYHGHNTGAITFEQTTSAAIMGYIDADAGTTEQAIMSVPQGKTLYITNILVSVGQADSADVRIKHVAAANDVTTPFRAGYVEWEIEDFSGAQTFQPRTYLKFEEYADIYCEAQRITGSGSARVSIDFDYILIDN